MAAAGWVRRWMVGGAAGVVMASPSVRAAEMDQLLAMDLQALTRVKVSLVSRIDEEAFDAASAIFVLTREEILRSGARRLPDLLRGVPGLHVGRLDANKWAIAARQRLSRFASTMLVMIDGRHVYTPLFGGVRWESLDLPLDTIDRIEVIRGSGGPLWGANAVDGIVHVHTLPASATTGSRVEAGLGAGDLKAELAGWTAWRHGETDWRVGARAISSDRGRYLPAELSTHRGLRAAGTGADDAGRLATVELRADRDLGAERWTWQAHLHDGRYDEERVTGGQVRRNPVEQRGGSVQLRWQRAEGAGREWRASVVLDRADFADDILVERQTTLDLDLQRSVQLAAHRLTFGAGWRWYGSDWSLPSGQPCVNCFGLAPAHGQNRLASVFVQDQWTPDPAWRLTAGAKFEHSDYADGQWQPTLRLTWMPTPDRVAWFALTRAVRTPTRSERDLAFYGVDAATAPLLGCLTYADGTCLLGDKSAPTWKADSAELGLRLRGTDWSADVAAFANRVDQQKTGGAEDTRVHGLESLLRWAPGAGWMLEGQWTLHRGTVRLSDGSEPAASLLPRQTVALGLRRSVGPDWEVDLRWRHVSGIARSNTPGSTLAPIPVQDTLAMRLAWRPDPAGEWVLEAELSAPDPRVEYVEALKVNTGLGHRIGLRYARRF